MLLAIGLGKGWSQTEGGQLPKDSDVKVSTPRATAEPDAPPETVESSPASGLYTSSSEPTPAASRSYFLTGLQVSEGAENNPGATLAESSQFSSLTSILGSIDLLKVRRRSETAIDYLGGGTFYTGFGSYDQQLQQVDADRRMLWRGGQLTLRDSFRDLRGGDFGSSAFGGASAYNLRFSGDATDAPVATGTADVLGVTQVGVQSQESYVTNVSVANLTEALTPRSSVFLTGAYSLTDYLRSSQTLFNSRQITTQAGYDYHLDRKTEIVVLYGYRFFQFPQSAGGNVVTNSVQFVYRRHISGRMDLAVGAGPELSKLDGTGATTHEINATAQASLHYRWRTSSVGLSYNRLVTAGSGLFAGGNGDFVRFSLERSISRLWRTSLDGGYARVSDIVPSTVRAPGSSSFSYGYAGAALQRQFGPNFSAFVSYQFNNENFSRSACGASVACNPGLQRHIVLLGFGWHIRPRRLE